MVVRSYHNKFYGMLEPDTVWPDAMALPSFYWLYVGKLVSSLKRRAPQRMTQHGEITFCFSRTCRVKRGHGKASARSDGEENQAAKNYVHTPVVGVSAHERSTKTTRTGCYSL